MDRFIATLLSFGFVHGDKRSFDAVGKSLPSMVVSFRRHIFIFLRFFEGKATRYAALSYLYGSWV